MENAQPVIIDNIYKDARIPQDAYRPTFVKSLAMVPIRRRSPIGAIGNYWAKHQNPSDELTIHARAEKAENFRPIGIDAILDRVLDEMAGDIARRNATIQRDALPWIWGDPLLIERLLQNLISNAIKFTPADKAPHITIGAMQEGEQWRIHVRDEGIGVAKDNLERIFGLFQRLHTQDDYPGSGLGFATCKKKLLNCMAARSGWNQKRVREVRSISRCPYHRMCRIFFKLFSPGLFSWASLSASCSIFY